MPARTKKPSLQDTLRLTLAQGNDKLALDLLIMTGYTKRAALRALDAHRDG